MLTCACALSKSLNGVNDRELSMKAEITVVVPVYNVAELIGRCLDSLIAQTETRWRCFCTDDGSLDGTAEALDAFTRRDARIRVIHQPNRGVAVARNRGLDRMATPYVTFVDPDDWIEPNHFERLYQPIATCAGGG